MSNAIAMTLCVSPGAHGQVFLWGGAENLDFDIGHRIPMYKEHYVDQVYVGWTRSTSCWCVAFNTDWHLHGKLQKNNSISRKTLQAPLAPAHELA